MSFEDVIKIESNKLAKSLNSVLNDYPNYTIGIVNDSNKDSFIDVYGTTKKKILTVKYEVLGMYDSQMEIFSWACDHKISDKGIVGLSKEVKKYSKKLKKHIIKKEFDDTEYMERLYYYLSNSMFFLEFSNLSDIMKISIFVTKCKGVLKQDNNDTSNSKNTIFYLVTDIISY